MWTINNQLMPGDCGTPRFRVQKNSVERWILTNNSGGWQHPIHIHFEEFQIISRSRGPNGEIPHNENSRKDVVIVRDNESVEVFFRFRDFVGAYPMHCHNTIHEDHAMMLKFDIDLTGDNVTVP
jgi:FtsP/CotA-like multicopper oxidase with cupredoxin domain